MTIAAAEFGDTREVAAALIAEGWSPVPVPRPTKAPIDPGWEGKTYRPEDFSCDDNIGGKCGAASGHRVDVDLDTPEAVFAAGHLLPLTRTHGRPSNPDSHCWYVVPGAKSRKFQAPGGAMLVEIRADGLQTILPGSVHTSGELIAWGDRRPALPLTAEELERSVTSVAICALVARSWPAGSRHYAALHLGGFLARAGYTPAEVERIARIVAQAASDEEVEDRARAARESAEKHEKGDRTTGGPALAKLIGAEAMITLCRWTSLDDGLVLDPQDPLASARAFVEAEYMRDGVLTIRHQAGVFYVFDSATSSYTEIDEASIRARLYQFLEPAKRRSDGALVSFKPTRSKVDNILDSLRALCNLPSAQAPPCWLTDDPGLAAIDMLAGPRGLLHVPTRILYPATPNFFTLNGLDYPYDESAPAPAGWLGFLDTLWPDDPESVSTLQEVSGYLLTPDTRFQKAVLALGPKRSGKGTIARVHQRLVGRRNTCSPTLASFGRSFGKQGLIGKTLAIISDARISGRTDSASVAETLLSISGEDDQTIERKFLSDWHGKLNVRFLLLANELPRIGDAAGALASRFVVLVMKQSFFNREDLGLFDRLTAELPGILNWAIEGRERLYARGHFLQPASANALLQEFHDLSSPESAFIAECCECTPGAEVAQAALFIAWRRWCETNGLTHPGTAQTFARSLRAVLPALTAVRHRSDDTQRRFWRGLRLKSEGRVTSHDLPFAGSDL